MHRPRETASIGLSSLAPGIVVAESGKHYFDSVAIYHAACEMGHDGDAAAAIVGRLTERVRAIEGGRNGV